MTNSVTTKNQGEKMPCNDPNCACHTVEALQATGMDSLEGEH